MHLKPEPEEYHLKKECVDREKGPELPWKMKTEKNKREAGERQVRGRK